METNRSSPGSRPGARSQGAAALCYHPARAHRAAFPDPPGDTPDRADPCPGRIRSPASDGGHMAYDNVDAEGRDGCQDHRGRVSWSVQRTSAAAACGPTSARISWALVLIRSDVPLTHVSGAGPALRLRLCMKSRATPAAPLARAGSYEEDRGQSEISRGRCER